MSYLGECYAKALKFAILFPNHSVYPLSPNLVTDAAEVIYLVNYEIPRLRPVIYVTCVRQATREFNYRKQN